MKNEPLCIPFKNMEIKFSEHINISKNNRILFSGKFGIGKTTFLKYFFENNKDYEAIMLYPINYSVSNNEDIFEYIKKDICYNLLSKDMDFEKTDFSLLLTGQYFVKTRFNDIVNILLTGIGEADKTIKAIYSSYKKLKEKFEEYERSINTDQKNELNEFINIFRDRKGSIYEYNAISSLITLLIQTLRNSSQKNIVLVIDDLDRIDPEHIFRLLNIFAAHIDNNDHNINKFGFDKIIFVCDIDNIRNMFHHKYGLNVDFNGYIDKFYCNGIFNFDFTNTIRFFITKLMDTFHNERTIKELGYFDLVEVFLKELVYLNEFNIRNIQLLASINRSNDDIIPSQIHRLSESKSLIYLIYYLLIHIYGSRQSLINTIEKCSRKKKNYNINDKIIRIFIHSLEFRRNSKYFENSNYADTHTFRYGIFDYKYDLVNLTYTVEMKANTDQDVILIDTNIHYFSFWDHILECFTLVEENRL